MSDLRYADPYAGSYPPSVWTVYSTGAAAGIPGTWTPAGSTVPASVAALIAGTPKTVVASPATAWTAGQYVQTQTAGVGGRAHWDGSAWVAGTGLVAVRDTPGDFTIAEVEAWVDENPDDADEVLAAEQGRGDAARVTLTTWLEGFISHRDEGTIP